MSEEPKKKKAGRPKGIPMQVIPIAGRKQAFAKFMAAVDDAVKVHLEIMNDKEQPGAVRLKAVDMLYERALGPAVRMHAILAAQAQRETTVDTTQLSAILSGTDTGQLREFLTILGRIGTATMEGDVIDVEADETGEYGDT